MTMLTVKLATLLMVGEAVSVNSAAADCVGLSVAPSLFHATVSCPCAFAGFHVLVAMLNVSGALPVFFT